MQASNKESPRPAGTGSGHGERFYKHNFTDIRHCLPEFAGFIASRYGVDLLGDLNADGNFHGCQTSEDRRGAKPFRYCVHSDDPQNVYFTDLKRGFSGVWFPAGTKPMTASEREQLRREAEARRLAREAQLAAWQATAAETARSLWRRSLPADPNHPYLVRKRVAVHGVRLLRSWERRVEREPGRFERVSIPNVLLVPMRDEAGVLWNVQAIFPEPCPILGRDKDFPPRARKKGLFHWIGQRTETVCVAEGYATAATIHEATGYRAIVAFDAGNLPIVAEIIRGMLPRARLVLCADHDPAGLAKATEAAERVDGVIATPPIAGADFNDWRTMPAEGRP